MLRKSSGSVVEASQKAKELEVYRKLIEAALNDVTVKAYALAGADVTRATPIAKSHIAESAS